MLRKIKPEFAHTDLSKLKVYPAEIKKSLASLNLINIKEYTDAYDAFNDSSAINSARYGIINSNIMKTGLSDKSANGSYIMTSDPFEYLIGYINSGEITKDWFKYETKNYGNLYNYLMGLLKNDKLLSANNPVKLVHYPLAYYMATPITKYSGVSLKEALKPNENGFSAMPEVLDRYNEVLYKLYNKIYSAYSSISLEPLRNLISPFLVKNSISELSNDRMPSGNQNLLILGKSKGYIYGDERDELLLSILNGTHSVLNKEAIERFINRLAKTSAMEVKAFYDSYMDKYGEEISNSFNSVVEQLKTFNQKTSRIIYELTLTPEASEYKTTSQIFGTCSFVGDVVYIDGNPYSTRDSSASYKLLEITWDDLTNKLNDINTEIFVVINKPIYDADGNLIKVYDENGNEIKTPSTSYIKLPVYTHNSEGEKTKLPFDSEKMKLYALLLDKITLKVEKSSHPGKYNTMVYTLDGITSGKFSLGNLVGNMFDFLLDGYKNSILDYKKMEYGYGIKEGFISMLKYYGAANFTVNSTEDIEMLYILYRLKDFFKDDPIYENDINYKSNINYYAPNFRNINSKLENLSQSEKKIREVINLIKKELIETGNFK